MQERNIVLIARQVGSALGQFFNRLILTPERSEADGPHKFVVRVVANCIILICALRNQILDKLPQPEHRSNMQRLGDTGFNGCVGGVECHRRAISYLWRKSANR